MDVESDHEESDADDESNEDLKDEDYEDHKDHDDNEDDDHKDDEDDKDENEGVPSAPHSEMIAYGMEECGTTNMPSSLPTNVPSSLVTSLLKYFAIHLQAYQYILVFHVHHQKGSVFMIIGPTKNATQSERPIFPKKLESYYL